MAQIDVRSRIIHAKIVYYGPSMSGKTTNLVNIHSRMPSASRSNLSTIATEGERTLYFDFVPIEPVNIGGWDIRFHLYSVPGQPTYNRTRRAILGGCDGVVLVLDSTPERLEENRESLAELRVNLEHYQRTEQHVPHVIQYNKADLPGALSAAMMDAQLGNPGWPTFSTSAVNGNGVKETLATISQLVAQAL